MRPFFCVVIAPTRELALQIKQQFEIFGESIDARVVSVMGGVDVVDQITNFGNAPHIIVSTPGRLASFIRSKSSALDLSNLNFFVIDEADRILDDGFGSELNTIIDILPKTNRQTLLFTATMNDAIKNLANGIFI